MSSAAATSWTLTPGSLLNLTAVALKRSPYFSILRGPAFATTHLRAVSPGCQLNRGKFGVGQQRGVRVQLIHSASTVHFVSQSLIPPNIRTARFACGN